MAYFLGMDGGGTTTFAVVTDEAGNVLGVGQGGNANFHVDYESAEESIISSAKMALQAANITVSELEYAWFGIAGGSREEALDMIREIVEPLQIPRFDVSGDIEIALRAGTNNPYGVVVLCGTGVNCAGRNMQAEFFQCGGYGFIFGDYGGGNRLAIDVFRAVCRQWDGRGERTVLTELLLAELGYDSVEAMHFDYFDDYFKNGAQIPGHFTKLLFPAVEMGDKVARDILTVQGEELGLAAKTTINRLQMNEDTFDIVLAGSVVTRGGNDIIKNEIERAVLPVAPNIEIKSLTAEPVIGAILLAMEASGNTVSKDVYNNLTKIRDIGAS